MAKREPRGSRSRGRRSSRLTSAGDAVREFLAQRGWDRQAKEARVHVIWESVVGERLSDHTETLLCRNGKLLITADTPEWAFELSMQRHLIAAKLNDALGDTIVTDIHVQSKGTGIRPVGVAPMRRKDLEFAGGMRVTDEELAALELPDGDIRHIEDLVASLRHEPIRQIVRNALMRDRRIRAWKLRAGYVECPRCGVLHNDGTGECLVCRTPRR